MSETTGQVKAGRPAARAVPVLYVDIDGTVRKGKDELGRFVNSAADVEVFPEAVERMRAWKQAGGRVAGVSNQGGIALGIVSLADVCAAMLETGAQCEGLLDLIFFCTHHPDAPDLAHARCWCRKPSAGAVAEAAHDLGARFPGEYYPAHLGLLVGDRPEDEQCARSAGLDFRWAAEWRAGA
jgi:D-glycero-D-manno-heptose 1,7-bisphosphate phosphatase